MFPSDLILTFFLLSKIFTGFMGIPQHFILHLYTFLSWPHLKKPVVVVFTHLTLVNILPLFLD
jgi:hypothetical protein